MSFKFSFDAEFEEENNKTAPPETADTKSVAKTTALLETKKQNETETDNNIEDKEVHIQDVLKEYCNTCLDSEQKTFNDIMTPLSFEEVPLLSLQSASKKSEDSKDEYFVLSPMKRILHSKKEGKRSITDEKKHKKDNANGDDIQISINENHTDLITGVYEGGLKLWECSLDLLQFLSQEVSLLKTKQDRQNFIHTNTSNTNQTNIMIQQTLKKALSSRGKILELGCGHGLPGIFLLRESFDCNKEDNKDESNGCNQVFFSDFNKFVLEQVTLPNILANLAIVNSQVSSILSSHSPSFTLTITTAKQPTKQMLALQNRIRLLSGDWMSLPVSNTKNSNENSGVGDACFDVILGSEITYTDKSCHETARLLYKHLRCTTITTTEESGSNIENYCCSGDSSIGLIAMKRYYFGCGGGLDTFMGAVQKLNDVSSKRRKQEKDGEETFFLKAHVLKSYDNGRGNIRDLVMVIKVNENSSLTK